MTRTATPDHKHRQGCENRRAMWQRLLEEVRQAGPRKIALLIVAAAIAILLAFGANSSNDAANGRTLPRASHPARLSVPAASHPARLYAPSAVQHP